MTRTLAFCMLFLLGATPSGPGQSASGGGDRLCEAAARDAAGRSGVPLPILRAILLAETGHLKTDQPDGPLVPWPWTLRSGDTIHFFETADATRQYALELLGAGQDSIGIGCFQLNWRGHGAAFGSVDRMLDPVLNARYAADLLAGLHRHTGDWRRAAGAYHSADPVLAEAYALRLETLHDKADEALPEPATPITRAARGPLIRAPGGPLLGVDP